MATRTVKPVTFTFKPAEYTPTGLARKSREELEKEYSRLRREALSRQRGFERSSQFRESEAYQRTKGKFDTRGKDLSTRDLTHKLIEVSKYVMSESSTVTGMRAINRRTINTLHESGYTWVNTKNLSEFGRFMEWARDTHESMMLDSNRVVDKYNELRKVGDENKVKELFDNWANTVK